MYLAFKHTHLLTAVLTVVFTLLWSAVAWRRDSGGAAGLNGSTKVIYILHRAVAGLAALTGLVLTFMGPWYVLLFPYLGLVAFILHGVAATASRRRFGQAGPGTQRRVALVVQVLLVLLTAYLMEAKPF